MYADKLDEFLSCLEASHSYYYSSEVFGGPSLYFHRRALADGLSGEVSKFAESSYAMLAAWGMHRMGTGGAKMIDFSLYEKSLKGAWPAIQALKTATPSKMKKEEWATLEEAFSCITAMRSSFSLVANSKVLAHAIPNLIPPVDRQYTIRFLNGSKKLPKELDGEWKLLKQFLEHFFYPAVNDNRFLTAYEGWNQTGEELPWNTSPLKTVDNLLVGHVRESANLPSRGSP